MGKRKSIFATEHGAPAAADPALDPEIANLMEIDAGKGVSNDPGEMIWTGGDNPFDRHVEFERWITDTALNEILLAIIDTHSDADQDHELVGRRRERLEQAKKKLLDRAAPRGAAPSNDRKQLYEIARRYWIAYATEADAASLSSIAEDVVMPNWKANGYTKDEAQGQTRAFINAFNKHKDRLLLEVSAQGLPDLAERAQKVAKVIALLGDLGIVRRPVP